MSETAPVEADLELLDELARQEHIEADAGVSLLEYAEVLRAWLGRLIGDGLGAIPLGAHLEQIVLVVVIGSLSALIVAVAFAARRARGHHGARPRAVVLAPRTTAPPATEDLHAALQSALGRGDGPAALRALWLLVVAHTVQQGIGHFEPEQTNREFIATVTRTRPDWPQLGALVSLGRAVDELAYGGGASGPDGIERVRALQPAARQLSAPAGP